MKPYDLMVDPAQQRFEYNKALRAYEAAHAAWMDTSIFNADAHKEAKRKLDEARTKLNSMTYPY